MSVVGYNTHLVKADDAPKSFADLLDPKWSGKMVKAHPGYSGNVMSATFQLTRDLGWDYLEKLAKQKIMQVQSSTDPPKKLALGERAVMVDGNEYNALQLKEAGQPIEIVYPSEGTPMAVGPNAIFKNAPNPNAARLLNSYMFTPECQQLVIDVGALRSVHPGVKEHAGRKPFKDIKVMKDDAEGVEKSAADIRARYSKIFGV
jgi:iron(III) transport system substrate-binding protein